ncbi:MAG: hydantoin utilization protein A [Myxococcota bacterium]
MEIVLAGVVAGLLHAITGPDHLAALAPLALRAPGRALRVGAAWGLGHGAGVVLLGGLGLAVRGMAELDFLAARCEAAVGVSLVLVGLWAIRNALRVVVHAHPHAHGGASGDAHAHAHAHVHVRADASAAHGDPRAHGAHTHAAFAVGVLHGAAGSGHLLAAIPSLVLSRAHAAAYLAAYLVAATASMATLALLLGRAALHRGPRVLRGSLLACGAAACVLGAAWTARAWPS